MLEAELDMSCYLMVVRMVGYNGLGFSLASRFANYWEKIVERLGYTVPKASTDLETEY
jgi:hypothetical protein